MVLRLAVAFAAARPHASPAVGRSLYSTVGFRQSAAARCAQPSALRLLAVRALTTTSSQKAAAGTVAVPEDAGEGVPIPTGGEGQPPGLAQQKYTFPRLVGGKQVGHILPVSETAQAHPFHLVDPSPWPKLMSSALLPFMGGWVVAMSNITGGGYLLLGATINVLWIMQRWLNDVTNEGAFMGHHTMRVVNNLVTGFSLFILSEVMLFFSIFWAFLHSSLSPSVELGSMWPPLGIEPLEAGLIPTLNTVLLVSSGASVTWAHHALLAGNRQSALTGMGVTLLFSCVFTALQAYEYHISPFTYADSVFGNTFYFSTGAHGLHVILGTTMLAIGTARIANYQLTQHHHVGLESAILYWHMVDVVWLALYGMVYWWGS